MKKLVKLTPVKNSQLAILILFLLALTVYKSQAQTVCTQKLRTARTVYEDGRFHELSALLSACIKNGFTDEERTEAYRLLVLGYIYLDEPENADEAMLGLLRDNPRFQINEAADPEELISLYKTFRTWPVFRYGAKFGINYSGANAISANGTNNLNDNSSKGEYEPNLGFRGGVVIEIPITPKFTFNPELYFSLVNFTYDNENYLPAHSQIEAQEKQMLFELPVLVQYQLFEKPYHPYVAIGVTPTYLLGDELEIERTIEGSQAIELDDRDIMDLRETFGMNATIAAGIKLLIGDGYYVVEGRINYGLLNMSDQSQSLTADPELAWSWRYADSEFKVNTVSLSVIGYLFDKYIPKKLKRK